MKQAFCRSCNAAIIWTTSAKGKPMPVDFETRLGGNIILHDNGRDLRALYAPADPTVKRYISHFVSCPQATKHRKRAPIASQDPSGVH